MAKTMIQQSQISGSHSSDVHDDLSNSDLAIAGGSLGDELNKLRTQMRAVTGEASYLHAITQNLSDIYTALHVDGEDAEIQGKLTTTGDAIFESLVRVHGDAEFEGHLIFSGTLHAMGVSTFDAKVNVTSGGMEVDGDSLELSGADMSIKSAAGGPSNFTVAAASGDVYARGTLDVDGKATVASFKSNGDAEFGGAVQIDGSDTNAIPYVDVNDKLVMTNSAGLAFDGSDLSVGGSKVAIRGDGSAKLADGDFTVSSSGAVYAAGDVTVGTKASIAADGSVSLADGDFTVDSEGAVVVGSTLEIDGALTAKETAEFQKNVTVGSTAKLIINSLTPTHIAFAGADNDIVDSENMTYTSEEVNFYSDKATVSSAGKLYLADDLEVAGGKIDLSHGIYVSSETAGELELHAAAVKFNGADLKETGGQVFASIGDEDDARNVSFKKNVEVLGNLNVKGDLTYIDTTNMRVQDAFVILANVGSAVDSGIVLVDGAGANLDLVVGQHGNVGEVVFGKGDRGSDGDGTMAGIDLVSSWMAGVKLSAQEGREEGRIEWNASDAAVKLAAIRGNKLELQADGDMMLKANGSEFSLAIAGDQAAFEAEFGADKSIIGAILSAASGGHLKKGSIAATDGASSLDFSSVGKLRADYDAEKDMDVYLNGVLLTAGDDYSIGNNADSQGKQIDLVGFSFQAGDKVTFLIRDAA